MVIASIGLPAGLRGHPTPLAALATLPLQAGLSQMSKEFEEEVLTPCCEFHFAGDRSIIGMCPQDVECDTSQYTKVFWTVVLAGSGIILVEYDVKPPVQLIFDAPMRARDFEQTLGRKPLR